MGHLLILGVHLGHLVYHIRVAHHLMMAKDFCWVEGTCQFLFFFYFFCLVLDYTVYSFFGEQSRSLFVKLKC